MMQSAGLCCVGDPGLASPDQFSSATADVRMKTLDVRDSATKRRRRHNWTYGQRSNLVSFSSVFSQPIDFIAICPNIGRLAIYKWIDS